MGVMLTDLIGPASGRKKCDLVLKNANIVNVFTQEILPGDIGISQGRIAGVSFDGAWKYEGETETDLAGRIVVPGLIDGHVHIESAMIPPAEFSRAVLAKGTTAVVADPHEIANVCGLDGIRFMLEQGRRSLVDIFFMLPSCVPVTPLESSGARLDAPDLKALTCEARVLGLGEVMDYPGVIGGRKDIIAKLDVFSDRIMDGHAPGLTGMGLNAYAVSGIRTEHECGSEEEMLEKLRLGFYILIREGSAAKNLKALVKAVNGGNFRRCVFCTDDRHLEDIIQYGHIDNNVRSAVKYGMDPVCAVTIATLNAAECYGLKNRGAVAPGYIADLVVLDDLKGFVINSVYKDGRLMADSVNTGTGAEAGGRHTGKESEEEKYTLLRVPHILRNTVKTEPLLLENLGIKLPAPRANIIRLVPGTISTVKTVRDVSTSEGLFVCRQASDPVKLAVLERHKATGRVGLGLLDGFGLRGGAIATTISHDSHNLAVAGDNDDDMLLAAEELRAKGGGITICSGGKVVNTLPLPLTGLMSLSPYEAVYQELRSMIETAHNMGIPSDIEPFMALSFLALTVIPEIRLTDRGLFDLLQNKFISVCAG